MKSALPSRRRFIEIAGVAGAVGLSGILQAGSARAVSPFYRWHGRVLGASANLTIAGLPTDRAEALVRSCTQEINRLENIFSLYRPGSALSSLNAAGELRAPPAELRAVLALVDRIHRQGDGAFDPTIQPLWRLYADHYAGRFREAGAPLARSIDAVRDLVGWKNVVVAGDRIAFRRPGMALTLNGIAQGYISDRVAGLMRRAGVDHALVNLGEINAIGGHLAGRPWQVGIAAPSPNRTVAHTLPLQDAAIATSGHDGTHFDAAGQVSHILDPRTCKPATATGAITVMAKSAAVADGLSTAACLLMPEQVATLLRSFRHTQAFRTTRGGITTKIAAGPT